MPSQWVQYWRAPHVPAEAMRARFTSHVYHRHSHDTYSFGVTEEGAQAFACRHGTHVSTTGLVMAFNPDDPHDGHSGDRAGFTYRMVHIQPEYFGGLIDAPLPLFRTPVIDDPALASAVTRLHRALTENASALARYEALAVTARLITRHASSGAATVDNQPARDRAERIRDLLDAAADADPAADLSAEDLAAAAFVRAGS